MKLYSLKISLKLFKQNQKERKTLVTNKKNNALNGTLVHYSNLVLLSNIQQCNQQNQLDLTQSPGSKQNTSTKNNLVHSLVKHREAFSGFQKGVDMATPHQLEPMRGRHPHT